MRAPAILAAGLTVLACRAADRPLEEFRGIVAPAAVPYVPVQVADGGTILGTVTLDGARPADSVIAITTRDSLACGRTVVAPTVAGTGDAVGGALVWLASIRRGRSLPLERRHELVVSRCMFEPRVLAITTESVVNVFNEDRALHRVSLLRVGTDDTLAVLPFYNSGQVVPTRQVAEEMGLVELRCETHPWSRAFVAAFDHPYFAVTGADGRFRMDSVPPGRYVLLAWHERMERPVADTVVVAAGGEARVGVVLPVGLRADTVAAGQASHKSQNR